MARIVSHNDESVREGYIRNGGNEVKLFTSALKPFQCNNRLFITQRKHLDDFLRGRQLDKWNEDVPSWKYPRNLESRRVSSPRFGNDSKMMVIREHALWTPQQWSCVMFFFLSDESTFSLQSESRRTLIYRAPGTRCHQKNTIERHHYGCAEWVVWEGIILDSRTYLHVQSVTMTGHFYRDVLLEQYVRLFRGAMDAEFLFMDDNARPHRANIVNECLQSEDITRMDWPAYSLDLNLIEHVWYMLGRRIAARQPPPTCLPELRRTLLDEWCNIPQDQIDNLILSMPRGCKACIASSRRHTPY
ncbi:transposable element Tcb2 transposase [Trichonephila clavipes]|nr:transposable element Tcb2 transposase [Trichonephila clavipes]